MVIDPAELEATLKRLKRVQGQIGGIITMIEQGRDCREIVTQVAAASKALANSGLGLHDVDLVIVATCTMPTPVPAAAPQLSHRLGIDAPAAFDISSGCSGFVYALSVASAATRPPRLWRIVWLPRLR